MTPRSRSLLLDLGLLYAAAVWGSAFFIVKGSLAHVHPMALVGYRFLASAACLAPFALRRPRPGRLLAEGAALGLILVVLCISQTVGLLYTQASNSGFISGLFVVLVPLFLRVFCGVPTTRRQWSAAGMALAGLWLLTGGILKANLGDFLSLVAAAAYAGHILFTDRCVRADADPVLLVFHQFWICGAICLSLAPLAGAPLGVRSMDAVWAILFLALFPNLSAFFIQIAAQRHIRPVKISLVFSLEPVFAALFAWTLGGEPFVPVKAAGGGVVLAATVLGCLAGRREQQGAKEFLPV